MPSLRNCFRVSGYKADDDDANNDKELKHICGILKDVKDISTYIPSGKAKVVGSAVHTDRLKVYTQFR
jgi:hypothetical protein